MSSIPRCPRCGAHNTSTSVDYKIKKGLGYAGDIAIGCGVEYYLGSVGTKLLDGVNLHDKVPAEYECSSCGYKWKVTGADSSSSYSSHPSDVFNMPIEDKFHIEGRGTVVTGRVKQGYLQVGDELYLFNPSGNKHRITCTGIEIFQKLISKCEVGDNVGILLSGIDMNEIESGAWLQKGDKNSKIDKTLPVNNSNPSLTYVQTSDDEQDYLDMYKEYAADGVISERDRKMLDKFRSRCGISEERARELEVSYNKPQLTEEEQEYLEMYKEYATDGEISERDRKMLNKMRDRMGISETKAKEIESLLRC